MPSLWWDVLVGLTLFLLVGASAMFRLYPTWRSLPTLTAAGRTPLTRGPLVHLFIPVRGRDPYLEGNLRSFLTQAYQPYRIIAVTDSSDDPAGDVIRSLKHEFPNLTWEVCGPPKDTAGKTHAHLVGISRHPEAEVYAFADADGRVSSQWLGAMLAALEEPGVGASTAYRVYVPVGVERGADAQAAWNLATLPAVVYSGIPWGGAMAISRELFEDAKVAERWAHTIADDCELREAMQAVGKQVAFVPRGLSMSPTEATLATALEWAGRQLTILRIFRKRVYIVGLIGGLLSFALVTAGVGSIVWGVVEPDLLLVGIGAFLLMPLLVAGLQLRWMLGIWTRRLRPLLADLRPVETTLPARLLRRVLTVQLIYWFAFLRPLAGSTIRWRGRIYRVRASRAVEILD